MDDNRSISLAQELMDSFARRTGLTGSEGNLQQRYLWTDAFAVQSFLGLAERLGEANYHTYALDLIETVHTILGRHRSDDEREGWISGLPDEEGRAHPTIAGLRIGKKLPERKPNEFQDEMLEWERDGQYFHYLTRWCQALLNTFQDTNDRKYGVWAAELLKAGEKFVDKKNGTRMYWKMNIDLSAPAVPSMGAHDPLEGAACATSVCEAVPEKTDALKGFLHDMNILCTGQNWYTTDALGIGGLLLTTCRTSTLTNQDALPENVRPENLWADSVASLKDYVRQSFSAGAPASRRLAFRECGLSLGLRVLSGRMSAKPSADLPHHKLNAFLDLADDIEKFWSDPDHQKSTSWTDHSDINTVSLAASLIARTSPGAFC